MSNELLPFLWVVNFYVITVVNFLIDKHNPRGRKARVIDQNWIAVTFPLDGIGRI